MYKYILLTVIYLLCTFASSVQANVIQLAYLQIEPATATSNNGNITYQVMWKQPQNTGSAILGLQFSEEATLTKNQQVSRVNGSKIEHFTLTTSTGLAGQSITIANLEKTNIEVMLKYSEHAENNKVNEQHSVRLTPDRSSYTFIASPSRWQTVQSYTIFGVEHILEGYDHLLFVLCLLLIASTTKKLFWAITGFTLAHSITLILSTLNVVQLPIVVVEAIIALSIVFLATEIVKNKKASLSFRYPIAVSSSFGLLHGFGFASVLMELGLPQNDQFLALAFFNLGVELGQLLFIAFVMLILALFKRLIDIKKYYKLNAYIIGSIASMWLIERVIAFY